jgi:hypothetical protein
LSIMASSSELAMVDEISDSLTQSGSRLARFLRFDKKHAPIANYRRSK